MNLNTSVSGHKKFAYGTSRAAVMCMKFVKKYPKVAEGFAEKDATTKDLEVAIDYYKTKAEKKDISYPLTLKQCYENRKVK